MAESDNSNILDTIAELQAHEPFVPFFVVLESGDRHRIEAPANLVRMRTEMFYAFPGSDKFVLMRMNQIVAVERLDTLRPRRKRAS
jgi:hypothetical protein